MTFKYFIFIFVLKHTNPEKMNDWMIEHTSLYLIYISEQHSLSLLTLLYVAPLRPFSTNTSHHELQCFLFDDCGFQMIENWHKKTLLKNKKQQVDESPSYHKERKLLFNHFPGFWDDVKPGYIKQAKIVHNMVCLIWC